MPVIQRESATQVDDTTAGAVQAIRAAMSAAPRVAVGHGTIRFRRPSTGPAAAQSSSSASTASAGPSGPVGHGTIRLRGRLEPSEQQAPPVIAQPDAPDEATAGAREDILAALSTTP